MYLLEFAGGFVIQVSKFHANPRNRFIHTVLNLKGIISVNLDIKEPRHTLGQNHKKHSIALLVPFVSKKGTNRGIICQFDILEKNPKGGPFYVKKIFISVSAQISCVSFQGQKHSTCEI